MVAAVVGDQVRGHVLAVGGALVVPAVAPHVGQTTHDDEGVGAAISKLNLATGVGLVESAELHVGSGHQVSVVKRLRKSMKIG